MQGTRDGCIHWQFSHLSREEESRKLLTVSASVAASVSTAVSTAASASDVINLNNLRGLLLVATASAAAAASTSQEARQSGVRTNDQGKKTNENLHSNPKSKH